MGDSTRGQRRTQCILSPWLAKPLTLLAVLAFSFASASMLAERSSAQESAGGDVASGFVFNAVEGGEFAGQSTQPPEWRVRRIDPATYLAELDAQGIVVPEPRPAPDRQAIRSTAEAILDRRQFALEHSDSHPAESFVDMIVELREVPFAELKLLKRMATSEREAVLTAREREIRDAQVNFTDYATQRGARTIQSLWLANQLRLQVPAGQVVNVLNHENVVDVHVALHQGTTDYDGYDGYETRAQTFLQRFVDDGFDGAWGGRVSTQYGGDDIKIAVIEPWWSGKKVFGQPLEADLLNDTHPGWQDCGGCSSRIRANYVCDGPCVPAPSSSNATHGTIVAGIIAGDLTDQQDDDCEDGDGNPCGAMGEQRRTGVARNASILYFRTRHDTDISSALFTATVWGADIVNLSQSIDPPCFEPPCPGEECQADRNDGGINEWIRIATDAGALVVGSGGNRNNDLGSEYPDDLICNLNYPSWRPEVVNVGGIGQVPDRYDPLDPYDVEPIGHYSSRGWVSVGVGGWYSYVQPTGQMASVAIVAPGVVNLHYTENDSYSDTSGHWRWAAPVDGNSFSVPVVSGAAGLLRQATGNVDARALKAMIMVMGDGTESRFSGAGYHAGLSEVYGAGRFKGHRFSGLEAPAGALYNWSWHLEEGEEFFLPFPSVVPSDVTNWKWAAYIDQPDLSQVPWVTLKVVDNCNGGGVIGATDVFFGLHKFVSLKAPALSAGQCPEVQIYGLSVPEGGVDVYIAGYYHSGDPDEH